MPNNLLKRIITSLLLLLILFIVIFTNKFIFILSILALGILIFLETHNIFSKIITLNTTKQKTIIKKINFKFLILNLITFYYIFFIFCNYSYEIYRFEGPIFYLYLISICIFTDIGGYTVGKILGGKKLTKISPNKTISGTLGSFIFCLLPLIIFTNFDFLYLKLSVENIIFCFLVSLISQLGDLFISYLKRNAKIKDTGKILPGHGGVLDRVDGIVFALPFSYFLLELI